jgi:formate hydrogenlyase subunit 3/multisubunit Na+/H+ antiporter MnhD subunit
VWSVFDGRYPALGELLLWLGAFTMLVGAALAVAQDDLKRMHAYSSVSQIGYVAAAIGLGTAFGTYAAVFFIVSHALAKGLLFLTTGAVGFAAHEVRSLSQLGGLRRRMPVTAACALVGALSLAGMPPFAGFLAKLQVAFAAADARAWVVVGIAVGTSLITMTYMTSMVQRVFRGTPRSAAAARADVREVPAAMRWAMGLLAAALLALGLGAGWIDPLMLAAAGR